jgi:hypothetical protein
LSSRTLSHGLRYTSREERVRMAMRSASQGLAVRATTRSVAPAGDANAPTASSYKAAADYQLKLKIGRQP